MATTSANVSLGVVVVVVAGAEVGADSMEVIYHLLTHLGLRLQDGNLILLEGQLTRRAGDQAFGQAQQPAQPEHTLPVTSDRRIGHQAWPAGIRGAQTMAKAARLGGQDLHHLLPLISPRPGTRARGLGPPVEGDSNHLSVFLKLIPSIPQHRTAQIPYEGTVVQYADDMISMGNEFHTLYDI